jgi:hypothetical protein
VLARLVPLDPEFLKPIRHRSEEAQLLRANLKVRSAMVEARTKEINTVRELLRQPLFSACRQNKRRARYGIRRLPLREKIGLSISRHLLRR